MRTPTVSMTAFFCLNAYTGEGVKCSDKLAYVLSGWALRSFHFDGGTSYTQGVMTYNIVVFIPAYTIPFFTFGIPLFVGLSRPFTNILIQATMFEWKMPCYTTKIEEQKATAYSITANEVIWCWIFMALAQTWCCRIPSLYYSNPFSVTKHVAKTYPSTPPKTFTAPSQLNPSSFKLCMNGFGVITSISQGQISRKVCYCQFSFAYLPQLPFSLPGIQVETVAGLQQQIHTQNCFTISDHRDSTSTRLAQW